MNLVKKLNIGATRPLRIHAVPRRGPPSTLRVYSNFLTLPSLFQQTPIINVLHILRVMEVHDLSDASAIRGSGDDPVTIVRRSLCTE
jgi:hypothetical protein